MADKAIVDRAGKGSDLDASDYDNNVDSMCGVTEEVVSGSHTLTYADQNKTIQLNHATATAVTIPAANAATMLGNALMHTTSFKVTYKNIGVGPATLTAPAGELDGETSMVLQQYQAVELHTNAAGNGYNIITLDGPARSVRTWRKASDIVAAATLPVDNTGNEFDVTGNATITAFAAVAVGSVVILNFDDAGTILTHDAADLVLPDGENITTKAGDIGVFYEYASADWRCISYKTSDKTSSGQARAYCRFTGEASDIASTLSGEFNVTSVTRNGSGIYDVVLAAGATMAGTDYIVMVNNQDAAGASIIVGKVLTTDTATTFSIRFRNNLGNAANPDFGMFTVFGDLA